MIRSVFVCDRCKAEEAFTPNRKKRYGTTLPDGAKRVALDSVGWHLCEACVVGFYKYINGSKFAEDKARNESEKQLMSNPAFR